jgi:hypothetical protein
MLFKDGFGGSYDAALYLQNLSNVNDAHVVIDYFDSSGALTCSVLDTIPPLVSRGYWLPGIGCLGSSWVGGVIVHSDENIIAVGRPHISGQVSTYTGIALP